WIDNLITGSGKNLADPNHRNYKLPYVQRYLDTIGERKCEANVLVTTPDIARDLCRDAIEGILGADARDRFVVKRHKVRERYEQLLTETGLTAALRTVVDSEDEDDGFV
ncbi:MAG: hypothetical protein ND866_21490, partial [Pyrinomonadaceae bacterium]|nr:hypothetical protein [Pyrinomonadaceae bacterium]